MVGRGAMFMPVIPNTAPKRFVPVIGLTGADTFYSFVLPRRLFLRIVAIKILRAAGELPQSANVLRQLLARHPRKLPLSRDSSICFSYEGNGFWITDTSGSILQAARAAELADASLETTARPE